MKIKGWKDTLPRTKINIKKRIVFPAYAFIWAICAILGYIEAGPMGLAIGLAGSVLSSIMVLLGVIPFIGWWLFLFANGWLQSSLIGLSGVNTPITFLLTTILFGALSILTCGVISLLVIAIFLAALAGN